MRERIEPRVGNWYQFAEGGQRFEVVAVDEENDTVEMQHFDGDLEEVDLDQWYELELESIEEPEDWTGPMDDIERDDLGYSDEEFHPGEDWEHVREELDRTGEE